MWTPRGKNVRQMSTDDCCLREYLKYIQFYRVDKCIIRALFFFSLGVHISAPRDRLCWQTKLVQKKKNEMNAACFATISVQNKKMCTVNCPIRIPDNEGQPYFISKNEIVILINGKMNTGRFGKKKKKVHASSLIVPSWPNGQWQSYSQYGARKLKALPPSNRNCYPGFGLHSSYLWHTAKST